MSECSDDEGMAGFGGMPGRGALWRVIKKKRSQLMESILETKDGQLQMLAKEIDDRRKAHDAENLQLWRTIMQQKEDLAGSQREKEAIKRELFACQDKLDKLERDGSRRPRNKERDSTRDGGAAAAGDAQSAANKLLQIRLQRSEDRYYSMKQEYKQCFADMIEKARSIQKLAESVRVKVKSEVAAMRLWLTVQSRIAIQKAQLIHSVDWTVSHDERLLDSHVTGLLAEVNRLTETYRREQLTTPLVQAITFYPIEKDLVKQDYQHRSAADEQRRRAQLRGTPGGCDLNLDTFLAPPQQRQLLSFKENLALLDAVGKRCGMLSTALDSKRSYTMFQNSTLAGRVEIDKQRKELLKLHRWFNAHVDPVVVNSKTATRVLERLFRDPATDTVDPRVAVLERELASNSASLGRCLLRLTVVKVAFEAERNRMFSTRPPPASKPRSPSPTPTKSPRAAPPPAQQRRRSHAGRLSVAAAAPPPPQPRPAGLLRQKVMQNSESLKSLAALSKAQAAAKPGRPPRVRQSRQAAATQTAPVGACLTCGMGLGCFECSQAVRLEMLHPPASLKELVRRRELVRAGEIEHARLLKERCAVVVGMMRLLSEAKGKVSRDAVAAYREITCAAYREKTAAAAAAADAAPPPADDAGEAGADGAAGQKFRTMLADGNAMQGLLTEAGAATAAARFMSKSPATMVLLSSLGSSVDKLPDEPAGKPADDWASGLLPPGIAPRKVSAASNAGSIGGRDWKQMLAASAAAPPPPPKPAEPRPQPRPAVAQRQRAPADDEPSTARAPSSAPRAVSFAAGGSEPVEQESSEPVVLSPAKKGGFLPVAPSPSAAAPRDYEKEKRRMVRAFRRRKELAEEGHKQALLVHKDLSPHPQEVPVDSVVLWNGNGLPPRKADDISHRVAVANSRREQISTSRFPSLA
ncbi:hypothetical protein DIPPA_35260 [Diplonema papillatum]|nr:hypothetical protein DIPPA_35260 [Diplonema papillatum]